MTTLCWGLFLFFATDLGDVVVVPIDGPPVSVVKFSADGAVVGGVPKPGNGEPTKWPLRDLTGIRFPSQPPTALSGIQLRLADDEALKCSAVESATADEFKVRGNLFGSISIPCEAIVGAILDPDADENQSHRVHEWLKRPRDSDALLFRNFDESKGSFQELDDGSVTMEVDGTKKKTPRSQVLALAFDPRLLQPKKFNDAFAFVRLSDGTRLRISKLTATLERTETATLETVLGPTLTVKREHLVDASIRNGRVFYLSDLKELKSTFTTYLDDAWPMQRDRAVTGAPMKIAGRGFDKGLGVRSGSSLTFAAAGYSRFEAMIGLDDAAGPLGHAIFSIEVDGKRIGEPLAAIAGAPPTPIRVPLEKAKTVTLRVDFGKRGDVQDFADWGDARFVK